MLVHVEDNKTIKLEGPQPFLYPGLLVWEDLPVPRCDARDAMPLWSGDAAGMGEPGEPSPTDARGGRVPSVRRLARIDADMLVKVLGPSAAGSNTFSTRRS